LRSVYNGGPLDRKDQRQTITPSSGLTWTGLAVAEPALLPRLRLAAPYIITTDTSRDEGAGVDVLRVPTQDGIDVGLEAKISFNTTFTGAPTTSSCAASTRASATGPMPAPTARA
jgi:hypothetical protein